MKFDLPLRTIGRITQSARPSTSGANMRILKNWGVSAAIGLALFSNISLKGLFGNLLLTSPRGFYHLTDMVEEKSVALVKEIIHKNQNKGSLTSPKTTVSMVDNLSNEICCAADLSDCIRNMHCDPGYSKAAEENMRRFTVLVETLNTMPELYESLKQSLNTEKGDLDEVSIRTAKLLLEDFEHSGVHLKENERKKFVELSDAIFESGSKFVNGVDVPTKISPTEAYQSGFAFTEFPGPWGTSNDYRLRKFTFEKYFQHNETQETHLRRLIQCRTELANLTNFPTFAHRAQLHSVLLNYDNVLSFLTNVIKVATPMLESEIETIRQILANHSKNFNANTDVVGEWDVEFATAIQRRIIFDELGESTLKEYLHMNSVLNGFEMLMDRLYGISLQVSVPGAGEIWPGNVVKLNVYQNKTNFLGTIYLDADIRPTKVPGDCHFTVRCSKLLDNGEFQSPIVVISLAIVPRELQNRNVGPLEVFETVKLSIQQAENFFHEMGHAIHSMLGRTRFQHVAEKRLRLKECQNVTQQDNLSAALSNILIGTRCPTDFAEVPSHLMECFFNDPNVIRQIFKDKSGRLMSQNEAEAMVSTRRIFGRVGLLQQVLYAIFDLSLHGDYANDFISGKLTSTELFGTMVDIALPGLGKTTNYAYHHRISHLVTYGAKYYSYLVARSAASLIYKNLMQKDPFSRENGLKWATIQSHGGEYPSHYLLQKILGCAPSAEQLTSVLVTPPTQPYVQNA